MNFPAFLALAVFVIVQSSSAQAKGINWSKVEARLSGATAVNFRNDLKSELSRRVRLFPRTVKVYHYGNRGTVRRPDMHYDGSSPAETRRFNYDEAMDLKRGASGTAADYETSVELTPPESNNYFEAMAAQFANGDQSWNVGPGLYAAVDPVQSENYLGNPWFLLEITVPKGMKYLDLRPIDGLVVSEAFVQKYLLEASLDNLDQLRLNRLGVNRFGIEIRSLMHFPKLRQALNDVLKELEVDVFAYAWSRHTYDVCKLNSYNQDVAFNFVNPDALNRGLSLKTFVSDLEAQAHPQKLAEYSRILDLIDSAKLNVYLNLDQNGKRTISSRDNGSRMLTLGWSSVLKREPTYLKMVGNQSELDEVKKYFVEYQVQKGQLTLTFLEKYKKTSTNSAGYVTHTLEYDPLKDLKENQSELYKERVQLIRNTVFGCDPRYPQENIPPEV